MRKLFSLMLVVLGAAALVSCSKDDDDVLRGREGEITFVTEAKSIESNDDIYFRLATFNAESITIDWGDGSGEKEYIPVRKEDEEDGEVWYIIETEHTYTDSKLSHTVTVRGKIKACNMSGYEVTSIDVTKCPALEGLYCSENQLTSLDVSGYTALKELYCDENQLTSLDVSGCTALEGLYCSGNQLTSLNVSKCTALIELGCSGNRFSASAMNKIYNDLPVVEYGVLWCDELGDYSIAEKKGWSVW